MEISIKTDVPDQIHLQDRIQWMPHISESTQSMVTENAEIIKLCQLTSQLAFLVCFKFSQFCDVLSKITRHTRSQTHNTVQNQRSHCQITGFTTEMSSITAQLTNAASWLHRIKTFAVSNPNESISFLANQ